MDVDLPDDDHVVRYVKPSLVDKCTVDGSAFILREFEEALSVNWIESLPGDNDIERIEAVRHLSRLTLSKNGGFAKLNVGATKAYVMELASEAGIWVELKFVEAPLSKSDTHDADPSHAEIFGLPATNSDAAVIIGDLIADCVKYPLYPGKE